MDDPNPDIYQLVSPPAAAAPGTAWQKIYELLQASLGFFFYQVQASLVRYTMFHACMGSSVPSPLLRTEQDEREAQEGSGICLQDPLWPNIALVQECQRLGFRVPERTTFGKITKKKRKLFLKRWPGLV